MVLVPLWSPRFAPLWSCPSGRVRPGAIHARKRALPLGAVLLTLRLRPSVGSVVSRETSDFTPGPPLVETDRESEFRPALPRSRSHPVINRSGPRASRPRHPFAGFARLPPHRNSDLTTLRPEDDPYAQGGKTGCALGLCIAVQRRFVVMRFAVRVRCFT